MTSRTTRTTDRRAAVSRFVAWRSGSPPPLRVQGVRPGPGVTPVDEIVSVPELDPMARLTLAPATYALIRASERGIFDRMTFRQRLMVYALDLDLTTELLGGTLFAPIIVGPVGRQDRFHPDAERATARGAAAALTTLVVSHDASEPIERIAAETDQPLWYQVYADRDPSATRDDAAAAVAAGCQTLCITVGVSSDGRPVATDWTAVEQLAESVDVPIVVKGIMHSDDGRAALDHGAGGLVVSNHGGLGRPGAVQPIEVLPAIADEIGDRAPLLVDGGFIRGSDVLKGLAQGATAVMIARPVMWGLSAYGAAGVEMGLRLLINELARNMAASGRPAIDLIDRTLVRIDRF